MQTPTPGPSRLLHIFPGQVVSSTGHYCVFLGVIVVDEPEEEKKDPFNARYTHR